MEIHTKVLLKTATCKMYRVILPVCYLTLRVLNWSYWSSFQHQVSTVRALTCCENRILACFHAAVA